MKTLAHSCKSKRRSTSRGFALIVTLSLMILLTVVAVGLLSLSSISLRATSQGQAMQTARANARLALMMALGDLQKTLGPDKRISARAETLAKDSRVGSPPAANTPESWWVGVSNSDGTTPLESGDAVRWLVSGQTGAKITTPTNPVDMIKGGSLDLAQFTGGKPIQAGRVPIKNAAGTITGNYAYFVDDDGMKAQLAASHPDVRNDSKLNLAGGILPGTYPLDHLTHVTGNGTADIASIQKLVSARNLGLLGVSDAISREKFFGYTTRSFGVLSDTRAGGLKKDLTIAFEVKDSSGKYTVFDKVFPSTTNAKVGKVEKVAVTPEKLSEVGSDFETGYINWATFRDYYNLKSSIQTSSEGMQYLWPTVFSKNEFVTSGGGTPDDKYTALGKGTLAPQQLRGTSTFNKGFPYGEYAIATPNNDGKGGAMPYRNNPVFPILMELWQKSWLTAPPSASKQGNGNLSTSELETNVQLLTSHYNPYNVGLYMRGDVDKAGPRVLKFPQVLIDVTSGGTTVFTDKDRTKAGFQAMSNKLQAHVDPTANSSTPIMLEPGRSQMIGIAKDITKGNASDAKMYFENMGDIVGKAYAAYDRRALASPINTAATYHVTTEYAMREPAFAHGVDNTADTTNEPESCQVFFALLAVDSVPAFDGASNSRPGKKFEQDLTATPTGSNGMNDNSSVGFQFALRSTTEKAGGIRPLVDANIRAQWNNPRWDSKLGLNTLAAYTLKFSDNADQDEKPAKPYPEAQPDTTSRKRGFSYWGSGRTASDGYDRVILFDIPRRDLVSLGQLQHASAGRFSYEPTYIAANSYANPRISLKEWKEKMSDTFSQNMKGLKNLTDWKGADFTLYDASYLVNEALWDSYTFTTIPQVADNVGGVGEVAPDFDSLLKRTTHLPNPRYVPYEPAGSKFAKETLQDVGTGTTGSFFHNAGHLLVDGAFNVNSTSVDAWEAFLTGTLDLEVRGLTAKGVIGDYKKVDGVRYPRVAAPFGVGMKTSALDDNYWTGFRELKTEEVRTLATKIVAEIKDRGPFLTLGAFVNRKLADGKNGKSGALQAALDESVNKGLKGDYQSDARADVTGNQGSGFPGQLLQGDVLQVLGPYITVHSDTFTIRAYGEAKSGSTITARAYCEAVVQRLPDPVKSGTATGDAKAELVLPSSPFGRQFSIVSFRWLHDAEI